MKIRPDRRRLKRMKECPWCRKYDVEIDMSTRRIQPHLRPDNAKVCVAPPVDKQGDGYIWTVGSAGLPTLGKDR